MSASSSSETAIKASWLEIISDSRSSRFTAGMFSTVVRVSRSLKPTHLFSSGSTSLTFTLRRSNICASFSPVMLPP